MQNKAVVVSDVHLGVKKQHGNVTPPDRNQFKQFLIALRDRKLDDFRDVNHLILNGDIEDLWRRHLRTLTRENYDIYNLLYEIKEKTNIQVHYVRGNHDAYARHDRSEPIASTNPEYYNTEHDEKFRLTIGKTNYRFKHGYQYDVKQRESVFDPAAIVSGDATGATFSDLLAIAAESGANAVEIVKLMARHGKRSFGQLLTDMDVETGYREEELGVTGDLSRRLGVNKQSAVEEVRNNDDIDWLCMGHTHKPGIKDTDRNDVDPSRVDSGVANSGTWKGGIDTYLVLEEHPRLMRWNNGKPEEYEYPNYPKRNTLTKIVDRLPSTIS